MVDACATNALDSAAVVNVCNVFLNCIQFLKQTSHSLVIKLFQTLLNSWYSGPTVAHAAVQRYVVRLADAALYSYPRIASQLKRHMPQYPFLHRAGA